jgi:nicotinamidase-related amidase
MNVIRIPKRSAGAAIPLIAMVDLQEEYAADGRAFHIERLDGCLANCQLLLEIARERRFPIAHFRRVTNGHFFNRKTRYADWLQPFQPRANEHVYERNSPSCFSHHSFCGLIENMDDPAIIFAGLSGEQSCLSTAIDSHHRGTRSIFVKDCWATSTIGALSERQSHDVVFDIVPLYAELMPFNTMLRVLSGSGASRGRMLD